MHVQQAELDAKKKNKTASKNDQPKSPKPEVTATPKPKKGPEVSFAKIGVTNGIVELIDKDGKPYVSATGLRTMLTNVNGENIEGWVSVARLLLHGQFMLTDLRGIVSNTQKGFIIPEMKANLGGGTCVVGFSSKPDQTGTPFTTKIKLDNVNLSQAASDADAEPPNLEGTLNASLEMKGIGDNRKTFTGKGSLTLRNGRCREMDAIRDVGEVFQMEQIANFAISEAKSDFEIGMDRVFIRKLSIEAAPLGITAQGSVRLDGNKLNLTAMFNADEKLIAKQIPELQKQFLPPDEKHQRGVAFEIEGSLTKPKNNLIQKITGTKDRKKQKVLAVESLILSTRPDKQPDKPDEDKPEPAPSEKP